MSSLLKVQTSSSLIQWPITVTPDVPTITIGGVPIAPAEAPTSPTGFQVAFIDASVDPPTFTTQYITLSTASQNWMSTAQDEMYAALQTAVAAAPTNHAVVVASFGMDYNLAPVGATLLTTFANLGATQFQIWSTNSDSGSESGNDQVWIGIPCNYICIAMPGTPPLTSEGISAVLGGGGGTISLVSYI